jgi:hypothetical protein
MNKIVDHPLWSLVVIPEPFKLVLCHLCTYLSRDLCRSDAPMATAMQCQETHNSFKWDLCHLVTYSCSDLHQSNVPTATAVTHHKRYSLWTPFLQYAWQTRSLTLAVIPNSFILVLCCLVTYSRRDLHRSNLPTASPWCTTRKPLWTPLLHYAW